MRSFANALRACHRHTWPLGLLVLVSTARAVTPDTTEGNTPAAVSSNPYLSLTNRNAFGIKPPPPPPDPKANIPPPAPPNLFVTGFSRLKGVKKAYLVVNRPGKSPDYIIVDEAYDVDGLKVTSIDPAKETLTVINGGTEVSLNFKDNGLKVANPPPGPMGNPGMVQPVPGGMPGGGPRPLTQVFAPGSPGAPTVVRRSSMEAPAISEPQDDTMLNRSSRRGGVYLGNTSGGGFPGAISPAPPSDSSLQQVLPAPSASSVPAAPGIIANPGSGRQAPPVPYLGK